MSFFSFSTPSLIGLDVKSDGVRLVQLKTRKQRYFAENLGFAALPPGTMVEGQIRRWDSLSEVLTALVEAMGLKGCSAAINLPAQLVRMQRIQVPLGLREEEIKAEIEDHLRKDLPDKRESLCMDFSLRPANDPHYLDVFFVAARFDYLSQFKQCVNGAGLQTKIVDVDIYALKRAAHFALQVERLHHETNALVSVINDMALLIVFNEKEIIFYQQWEVKEKTEFLVQLKSRMQMCLTAFHHLQIHKLLLSATQGYLTSLLDDLTPTWAYHVFCPNPFKQIELSTQVQHGLSNAHPADFLMACGAAMRSVPRW